MSCTPIIPFGPMQLMLPSVRTFLSATHPQHYLEHVSVSISPSQQLHLEEHTPMLNKQKGAESQKDGTLDRNNNNKNNNKSKNQRKTIRKFPLFRVGRAECWPQKLPFVSISVSNTPIQGISYPVFAHTDHGFSFHSLQILAICQTSCTEVP